MAKPIYTGRREIYEEKFIYFNDLSGIFDEEIDVNFVPTIIERITQAPYNTVCTNDELTLEDKLKLEFIYEGSFNTTNNYKYVKKIELVIDTVSIQTFNYYKPGDDNADRGTNTRRNQLNDLLPINININNKEIVFTGEYSKEGSIKENGRVVATNEPTEAITPIPLNTYSQTYNKTFEISSFPSAFNVKLNFNQNLFSTTLKNPMYQDYHKITKADDINDFIYRYSAMINFRIDGRIMSYIDYTNTDVSPTRLIPNETNKKIDKKKKKTDNITLNTIFPSLPDNIDKIYNKHIVDNFKT